MTPSARFNPYVTSARASGRLGLCVVAVLVVLAGSVAQAARPEVLAWRQRTFAIPFRVNPGSQPAEVRLFVSVDRGQSWQLSGRAQPNQGSLTYRAASDGEYWFSLRTVDPSGRMSPNVAHQPELIVQVDTLAPRLELSAERGPAGEVELRWQAVDPNLQADSLKIEYQTPLDKSWRSMAVRQPAAGTSRSTRIGKATWWPDEQAEQVKLRATVTDRAGNQAVSQAMVQLQPASTPGAMISGPVQSVDAPDDAGLQDPPKNPFTTTGQPRAVAESPRASPTKNPNHWPADQVAEQPLSLSTDDATLPAPNFDEETLAEQPAEPTPSAASNEVGENADIAPGQPRFAGMRRRPLPSPRVQPTIPQPQYSMQPSGPNLHQAQKPAGGRLVNKRSFELEYDIDSGQSGLAAVELWGTRDGGRTWALFGRDSDNESPLQVFVDREGTYGFCVVGHTATGLHGRRPQNGEPPDATVTVDLKPPAAKLLAAGATPNQGDDGTITIRWQAADPHLAPRPVKLSYATDPFGEWTTIAADIENDGVHHWQPDDTVPDHCFIRLDVRDEAGNVASQFTRAPVALSYRRPAGRIRTVRPLDDDPVIEQPEPTEQRGPATSPLQQPLDGPAFSHSRSPSGSRHR